MDRAAFTQRALEIVKEARPFDASVIDEERFAIVSIAPDGGSRLASLGHFWSEYTSAGSPRAKEAVFERIARFAALIDSGESLDEIRVLLMPRIRARATFEIDMKGAVEAIRQGDAEVPSIFYRPLAEHLGIGLAIDRPDHLQYISDVSSYPLSGDQLLDIALTNLRDATKTGFEKLEAGLWVGHWGDDFAPERILLADLFRDLPAGAIVFLPGADRIYVVDPEDRSALTKALRLVDERLERARGLVPFALRREEGEWRVVDDPEFPVLGERLTAFLAPYYEAQREAYMAARDRGGDATLSFCSSILSVHSERGSGDVSMVLWSKFQDTLLPQADTVSLVDLDRGVSTLVRWRRFRQLCSECVSPVPNMYPPRYRTLEFPSDEVIEELAKDSYKPVAPRERARSEEREAPFKPLTEPEPPEQVGGTDWSVLSGKTVALLLIGLGGVVLACGLIDKLSGCG